MDNDNINSKDLFEKLDRATGEFFSLIDSFDEQEINTIPFGNSWTAAQVADHVTKSNISIAKALQLKGTAINRDPYERTEELKDVFLDFTTKLKSPSFILPGKNIYEKVMLINQLRNSIEKIKDIAEQSDLSEMINHPAFGDITKLEILHFVIYHTKRHSHQLENIFKALAKIKSV